jgi:catechol 2,3-dioxygenase-like lactoylglutathione lyase family enzyme
MPDGIRVHHLAVVVPDLEQALRFWRDALGLLVSHIEEVPEQASQIAFLPAGEAEIELVHPTRASPATWPSAAPGCTTSACRSRI